MSHNTEVKTEIRDVDVLAQALADVMGIDVDQVEKAGDDPLILDTYETRYRGEKIHGVCRVPRRIAGGLSDVGFRRTEDGTVTLVVDEDDQRHRGYGTEEWMGKLAQRYGYHQVQKLCKKRGRRIVREKNKDGVILLAIRR